MAKEKSSTKKKKASSGSQEEARRELLGLRFRRAMGETVNGSRFRELRRTVARCLTAENKKKA
ncbi:MAG: 50S ribosomal protein L29 [Holosporales bacterium]|jgi:ribosomal protein L29|nr:50S ribosomal protein L29 [Holosporales bacterium]